MATYRFTVAVCGRVQSIAIRADYHDLQQIDGAPTRVFHRDTRPIAWVPVSIIVDPPQD